MAFVGDGGRTSFKLALCQSGSNGSEADRQPVGKGAAEIPCGPVASGNSSMGSGKPLPSKFNEAGARKNLESCTAAGTNEVLSACP